MTNQPDDRGKRLAAQIACAESAAALASDMRQSRPMTDEKQDAAIKQRAAEIATTVFLSGSPHSVSWLTPIVERALREGMAMRVPDQICVEDVRNTELRIHKPNDWAYVQGWNDGQAAMLARNGE